MDYTKYYEQYRPFSILKFAFQAMVAKNKVRKISLINRMRDYQNLHKSPDFFKLHLELNKIMDEANKKWMSYDYGEGYFYQSFPKIGISGLRDTCKRVQCMNLNDLVKDKKVLEIGCNTGFVSLSIADSVSCLEGFDVNPFLIEIANKITDFLGEKKTKFFTTKFEDYLTADKFDVVLSFANHSTYDQNTEQDLISYFQKCHELLLPNGKLLFESHPPDYEGNNLNKVISVIQSFFDIEISKKLYYGSYLDKGRTFIAGRKSAK